MAYTVEYSTTGQRGCDTVQVTNRYGRFSNVEEAADWLIRNPCKDGRIVPALTVNHYPA